MSWASDALYGSKGRGKGCFWKSLARPFDAVCRVLYNYCRPDERLSLIGLLIHVSLMQHSYKYHTFIFRFLNQEYDTVPPSIMAARFHQDPELCSCSGTCSSLPPRHHMNPEKSAAIRSPRKLPYTKKRGHLPLAGSGASQAGFTDPGTKASTLLAGQLDAIRDEAENDGISYTSAARSDFATEDAVLE
jgi:hypothetical protein